MKKTLLCSVLLITVMFLIGISEANAGNTYKFKSDCPNPAGGKMVKDDWDFYKCECVSFAAYKLNQIGVAFKNDYKKVHFGPATNWSTAAQSAGISQDSTPKVGDIAWFNSSRGHVAYVEKLNTVTGKDGKTTVSTIDIVEYNYTTSYDYSTRTIKPNTVSKFIHFK